MTDETQIKIEEKDNAEQDDAQGQEEQGQLSSGEPEERQQQLEDGQKQEEISDEQEGDDSEGEEGDDIVSISLKPEEDEESSSNWVSKLRKKHKEAVKRNKDLEAELQKYKGGQEEKLVLGPKPTIQAVNYDSEIYEKQLDEWYATKIKIEAKQKEAQQKEKSVQDAWQQKLAKYNEAKKKLNVKDFSEAEDFLQTVASTTQQAIIVKAATHPEMVVYALNKYKGKAEEIFNISDPIEFTVAMTKFEADLKIAPKKSKRVPEKAPEATINSGDGVIHESDKKLEKLRKEAETTGNYTKVHAYKVKLRRQQLT